MPTVEVLQAVDYLDTTIHPGWVELIDVDKLDMRHAGYCVLGQLQAYADGVDIGEGSFWDFLHKHKKNLSWAVENGFMPPISQTSTNEQVEAAGQALTDQWKEFITARRLKAPEGVTHAN